MSIGVTPADQLPTVVRDLDELTVRDRDTLLEFFLTVAWPTPAAQSG
jgi:hypothetical protein